MGKPKYIETPEKMWELFQAYKKKVKGSPRFKNELDKLGKIVPIPLECPLTLEGFENYCADEDIINDLGDYFSNKNDKYKDYSTICLRVKRAIREDQISGGMVGQYNPSITQRLNNLTEKTETTIISEQPLFPD